MKEVHALFRVWILERKKVVAKKKLSLLFTMQLKSGLRKNEETFLAALVEIKPDKIVEVPDCVNEVLDEFEVIIALELPKQLLPRRATDHKIELIPGSRAPTQAPYRMAPFELVELRKQLNELLEAGLIQPLKAPYGAPVLFQRKAKETLRICVDYRALNK
ncbi:PREDICTED: reverse mRNAase, partial [Prunus dulcis]